MSDASKPGVGNAAGVALLILNVSQVPALIRSVDHGTVQSYGLGLGLALAAGAASSALARTPWPFLGTVAMCGLMLHLKNQRAPFGVAATDTV